MTKIQSILPHQCRSTLFHDDAIEAFLRAEQRQRLHHAWMIVGVKGLGKSSLAHRFARHLLSNKSVGTGLRGQTDDADGRLIEASSHPDFYSLATGEGGNGKKSIGVDDVRGLNAFFSQTPSRSQYRVAIIDSADDMNLNASNALLKTLEEPPQRGIIFLIVHRPSSLLVTIRSRCRLLKLKPLTTQQLHLGASELAWEGLRDWSKQDPPLSLGQWLDQTQDEPKEMVELINSLIKSVISNDLSPKDIMALMDKLKLSGKDHAIKIKRFSHKLVRALRLSALDSNIGFWNENSLVIAHRIETQTESMTSVNIDSKLVFHMIINELVSNLSPKK
jgi:DNA polymerase-3 subunit delta'